MMNPTQIFGPKLLPMMEYVGFLLTIESHSLSNAYCENNGLDTWDDLDEACMKMTIEAHSFLSRELREEDFVRPDEIYCKRDHLKVDKESKDACDYCECPNWQPLFKGEWEIKGDYLLKDGEIVIDMFNFRKMNYNDFAAHCFKQGIPLELNEEYEND